MLHCAHHWLLFNHTASWKMFLHGCSKSSRLPDTRTLFKNNTYCQLFAHILLEELDWATNILSPRMSKTLNSRSAKKPFTKPAMSSHARMSPSAIWKNSASSSFLVQGPYRSYRQFPSAPWVKIDDVTSSPLGKKEHQSDKSEISTKTCQKSCVQRPKPASNTRSSWGYSGSLRYFPPALSKLSQLQSVKPPALYGARSSCHLGAPNGVALRSCLGNHIKWGDFLWDLHRHMTNNVCCYCLWMWLMFLSFKILSRTANNSWTSRNWASKAAIAAFLSAQDDPQSCCVILRPNRKPIIHKCSN